ncbi:MFS transporter [Fimbriimonas ginsengisoli]|uniref:Hexuronate transporter n=1 Tax=Fimbriimonas ginsengisoli Gsoil 348 TaxID=661478 RepID=A0A068NK34_FIMGI|nr:MFS transporter [Fimbriimonas ginsengisoli]AIE83948.1 Hexuronate transporter [Fimbriimonas ginsengisoli Gsoil 348]
MNPTVATRFRWTICALIFFATTVNYLDRFLFSLLVPFFEDELRLGPTDLALLNVSFALPYGFVMIFVGRYVDRVGIKRGLGSAFLLWNVASIAHAFVNSLTGFIGIRFLLGVGESGMFPSAVKTMTEWFPVKERSLATGLFNAGSNMGAMLAPLIGVAIAAKFGWRTCFFVTGGVGIVWIFFWNKLYRSPEEHPKVSESELAYIRQDREPPEEPVSFAQLFAMRPVYGLGIAKALSDAPWWLYLTWVPKFLVDQFHVSAGAMALAIPVIYLIADVGSVAGGWLSSLLIHRGLSVGKARKLTMLACAILVLPVMTVGFLVDHAPIAGIPCFYWAVGIIALAAGAHQGWSCNLFTLISDSVPKNAIAVAVGAINGFAMVGVAALQFFVGWSVQVTSSYTLPFVVAGLLYLVALVVIQIFLPRVERVSGVPRANMSLVYAGAAAVIAGLGMLQYLLNKPPYTSLSDYLAKRSTELKASGPPVEGPAAHVGWMEAHWYMWQPATGKPKLELIKLDTQSRPFVESKGVKAARYKGPDLPTVNSGFHLPQ